MPSFIIEFSSDDHCHPLIFVFHDLVFLCFKCKLHGLADWVSHNVLNLVSICTMLSNHNIGYIIYVITVCGMSHLCNVLCNRLLTPMDCHIWTQILAQYSCKTPHAHAASLTTAQPKNHNVHTLTWPSTSLDFNPFQDLWDVLDQKIKNQPRTLADLRHALNEE